MGTFLKVFFKVFSTLLVILTLFLAIYFTVISSGSKGTVKDMTYDLTKSEIVSFGDKKETAIYGSGNGDLRFETQLSDIELESLNPKSYRIREGDEYYLFFTVTFTPLDSKFELKNADSIGMISSNDWKYTMIIDPSKSESDYHRTINKGETVTLRYYIKTDEPLEALGLSLSGNISKTSTKEYLSFVTVDERNDFFGIEKNPTE